ncbi:unnamed protein product [Adineta ricciae]|uniref:Peptidase C1A papain C-terminal domain-containing protein n=1 Tax=Adineta ricciae TaxID=249248 RepID=A0A815FDW5_ADIRI|nr:unnamed protein product [Adineta ricciae]
MYSNGLTYRFYPFLNQYHYSQSRRDRNPIKDVSIMRPYSLPNGHLSSYVDLRRWMTPVEHQQDMNTCCANAFAGVCEYLIKLNSGRHIDVSRLFIYYNAQIIGQKTRHVRDAGSEPREIALGLRKYGVCDESTWPYDQSLLNTEPSAKAYEEASKYTVVLLKIPFGIKPILKCLHNKIPVVVNIKMVENAGEEVKYNHGILSIPRLDNTFIRRTNSHAVLIVGYDLHKKLFIVRNSWGNGWGDDGYFRIPFDYLNESRLTHSIDVHDGLWTVQHISTRKNKLPTVRRLMISDNPLPQHHRGHIHQRRHHHKHFY